MLQPRSTFRCLPPQLVRSPQKLARLRRPVYGSLTRHCPPPILTSNPTPLSWSTSSRYVQGTFILLVIQIQFNWMRWDCFRTMIIASSVYPPLVLSDLFLPPIYFNSFLEFLLLKYLCMWTISPPPLPYWRWNDTFMNAFLLSLNDFIASQDYRNTQNLKLITIGETRTSTDVILSGFSKDVGSRRTNLDTTVRN